MFNAQIPVILLVVSILASGLAIGLIWRWRKTETSGTIAPYSELKRQMKEGTAKPFLVSKDAVKRSPISWDQILQIPDSEKRYIQMSEFVLDKERSLGYSALSDVERIILHVFLLESEVNNGGFDQYFFNSAGDYALETAESLRRIGSKDVLALLNQAIEAFGPDLPSKDRETRWAQMDTLPETASEKWDRLENEFFTLTDTESLADLVVDYAEGHA
jgi:hypothetical protein